MSKKWTLLTLILFFGSGATLQAQPLDSPDVVYIDGQPCNRACQSYMDWTYRALSARRHQEREISVAVPEAEIERVEPVVRPRVAKHAAQFARPAPRAGVAASSVKPSNGKASHSKNAAAPKPAHQAAGKAVPTTAATVVPEKPAEPERKSGSAEKVQAAQGASVAAAPSIGVPKSETVKSEVAAAPPAAPEVAASPAAAGDAPASAPAAREADIAVLPPAASEIAAPPATSQVAALPAAADAAPASVPRTIQEQVAEATGMAERVTAITLEREAAGKSDNPGTESANASDADTTASTSPIDPDNLVALVLARPEINSLSDLNNRNIAIEPRQSAASGSVSAALMAAGAAEVQFSDAKSGAVDRLISGEVPAAVVTLASREAAEWFPDIAGFRIFRVPLSPRARL